MCLKNLRYSMFLHLVFLSKCDVAAGAFVKISHVVKGSGEMLTPEYPQPNQNLNVRVDVCVFPWSVNLNILMITVIINTRAHSSLQLFHQYSNYIDDTAFFVIWVFNFLKNFCIILYWHGGVSVSYIIVWFRKELFF